MRAFVYIDGFNLYYRALRGTPYRWLDLDLFSRALLRPHHPSAHVAKIRYFTARVKSRAGSPMAPRDQQVYLSAVASLPNVETHFGTFLTRKKERPLADIHPPQMVTILHSEEKGSDVSLASHLINDAWKGVFDLALIVSQDTDLIEAIRIVREERKLPVGLVMLDKRGPAPVLKNLGSFLTVATPNVLAASQFSHSVVNLRGREIQKPSDW